MARCSALLGTLAPLCVVGLLGCNSALISLLPEATKAAEAGASDAAPVSHPVGQWALDSDGTDPLGGNNGVLLGAATFSKDATRGDALVCNGVDAALRIANTTVLNFTYAAWIWSDSPSKKGSSAIDGDALIWSNVTPALDDFTLAVLNDRLSYISYSQPSTGTAMVTDAKWHHVAVTRKDGERVALYVDGLVDGDGNSGSGPLSANMFVYFCGADVPGHYFKGRMDDVRQYDRVLSAAEIHALFVATR